MVGNSGRMFKIVSLFTIILILHDKQTLCDTNYLQVPTPNGIVRGKIEQIRPNREVVSFLGVPFGEPPVGDLRFRPPQMVKPWTGVHEALSPAKACVQGKDETYVSFFRKFLSFMMEYWRQVFQAFWGAQMWNYNNEITENCLFMNIWVPKNIKNATVMVWLFGGGFWYGSPSLALYDGRVLAVEGNVIVVVPNYRLGAFGFLYLDDEEVPGNVGLLDQQLALKWIEKNIASFGGDPKQVSLFGESAGAACIVAHMVAPSSRSLFKNGILQSGSLDNPWAMDTPQRALNKSMQLAKAVGCDGGSKAEIISCLRKLPAETFIDKLWEIKTGFLEFPLVVVSKDKANFFVKDAFQALRSGDYRKTDIMIGINADEGTFWMVYYLKQFFTPDDEKLSFINDKQFVESVNIAFPNMPLGTRQGILYQYWDKECTRKPTFYREAVNQIVGDYFFTCDSIWLADQIVNKSMGNVYIYHFEQRSTNNPWPDWMGVMHGYEIEYVFGFPIIYYRNYSERFESNFSREIIHYWKTFAEKGKPELSYKKEYYWPPYTNDDKSFYVLKAGDKYQGLLRNFKENECKLWRSIRDTEFDSFVASLTNNRNEPPKFLPQKETPEANTANSSQSTVKELHHWTILLFLVLVLNEVQEIFSCKT